jgi:hypothetical protein
MREYLAGLGSVALEVSASVAQHYARIVLLRHDGTGLPADSTVAAAAMVAPVVVVTALSLMSVGYTAPHALLSAAAVALLLFCILDRPYCYAALTALGLGELVRLVFALTATNPPMYLVSATAIFSSMVLCWGMSHRQKSPYRGSK